MKTVTRTRDGSEHKHVFYDLGIRHEVVYVFNREDVLVATHITMEVAHL